MKRLRGKKAGEGKGYEKEKQIAKRRKKERGGRK